MIDKNFFLNLVFHHNTIILSFEHSDFGITLAVGGARDGEQEDWDL